MLHLYKKINHLFILHKRTCTISYNDKHAFSEPSSFPQALHLPSLKRHVRGLTAEKTQRCAQGYRWKLDEYLYLPAEESEDLGGGESLSAVTHKSSEVYHQTTAMPATKVAIMIKLR